MTSFYASCFAFYRLISPSCMSLRRILTKVLSLAASRGSSLPSADDQLGETEHQTTTALKAGGVCEVSHIFYLFIFYKHDRRILLVSFERFAKDLTLQGVRVHGVLLQHGKRTTRQASPNQNLAQSSTPLETGSHLVDVLQQVQSLFEVVLVGPSVVVADVQLQRGRQEEVGAGQSHRLKHTLVYRNRIKKNYKPFMNNNNNY